MAIPASQDARLFYRSARERLEDGRFLEASGRTTGAVYIGRYGIECILKALILASLPNDTRRVEMLESFRGARGHDIEWLKEKYRRSSGRDLPGEMGRYFARINFWNTAIRYTPRRINAREAARFMDAVAKIFDWADGRL